MKSWKDKFNWVVFERDGIRQRQRVIFRGEQQACLRMALSGLGMLAQRKPLA